MDSTLWFFHHIPKTAGTTLNTILDAAFAPHEVRSVYGEHEYEQFFALHSGALTECRLLRGHLLVKDFDGLLAQHPRMRIVTFLREPVARVVSEFRFLRTWPQGHIHARLNADGLSLRDYVESAERRYVFRNNNLMTTLVSGISALEHPGAALARAKRNVAERFAFTGVMERFDESLLLLARLMGLKDMVYEAHNVARPHSARPDAETLARIAERNQLDTALHLFASELLEERLASAGGEFFAALRRFRLVNERYQRISRLIAERDCPETLQRSILNPK